MQQLISLLVENKPGALLRVAGLLTARGYNIESLTVAKTLDPTLSNMTIVAEVDHVMRPLLIRQMKRLVNVVQAVDLTESPSVNRELALIKVHVSPEMRTALLQEADIFRARVVDAAPTSYTLEVTGAPDKLDALITLLHNYGEVEMIRSGSMAMARSPQSKTALQEAKENSSKENSKVAEETVRT